MAKRRQPERTVRVEIRLTEAEAEAYAAAAAAAGLGLGPWLRMLAARELRDQRRGRP